MPPIKKLTSAHKFVVVKHMAAFESPTAIARLLAEEYGVSVAPQSLYYYDPMRNESLPRMLSEMFYNERGKFLRALDAQPMQSLAFRQAQRDKIFRAVVKHNPQLALAILNDASTDSFRTHSKTAEAKKEHQEDSAHEDWMPKTRAEKEALILKMLTINPIVP